MKLCRFNDNRLGVVQDASIKDVSVALDAIPAARWPLPPGDQLIANLATVRAAIDSLLAGAPEIALADAKLLSPVANPSKIIGAPVNYQAHYDEATTDKDMHHGAAVKTITDAGLFLKTPVPVGPSQGVSIRFPDRRNDHEVEIAMIIGQQVDRVSRDTALDCVAGYAIGLDMTVRGTEERSLRKAIDSYSVLGPWMVTADEVADPDDLEFSIEVDGTVRQKSSTANLIYDCRELIVYASSFYTLYPGDVIMTGTPEGVGPVQDGNVMHCRAETIGDMHVPVRVA